MLEFLHKYNLTHFLLSLAVASGGAVFGTGFEAACLVAAFYYGREAAQNEILEEYSPVKEWWKPLRFWTWGWPQIEDMAGPVIVLIIAAAAGV